MSATVAATIKKTTRAKKITEASDQTATDVSLSARTLKPLDDAFVKLANTITTAKDEYGDLQKQIAEIKEIWDKEQLNHKVQIAEINQQDELARKHDQETYEYETMLVRKKTEDEFLEKKAKWERELLERKEEIAREKQELEMLRKQVGGFEEEKDKTVKEACASFQKQLQETFATERKLREQEIKAEKELLGLKITNLTQENGRLTSEVELLKKSLEEATRQLKDVALKVIESSGTSKLQTPSEL